MSNGVNYTSYHEYFRMKLYLKLKKENSVVPNIPVSYQYYNKTCLLLKKYNQLNFISNLNIWQSQSHTYYIRNSFHRHTQYLKLSLNKTQVKKTILYNVKLCNLKLTWLSNVESFDPS